MAAHFSEMDMYPSGFGVTLFFVISGLRITPLLPDELYRTSTIDLIAFHKRRAVRLAIPNI